MTIVIADVQFHSLTITFNYQLTNYFSALLKIEYRA